MNEDDIKIVETMEKHGGSFVKALANACRHADHYNLGKIRQAFEEYWETYREMAGCLRKTPLSEEEDLKE